MTKTQRIILNIVATYGRSIFTICCGIFSMRWVLMALGQENFGLYGLIGGLIIFITFLNIQLSQALSRFYAVAIGQAEVASDKNLALTECRSWFTSGVLIHTIVPLLLVLIGCPIGICAIKFGWLTIPVSKVDVCVWVWIFACLSALVGMVNTPFSAMYGAKQYIAELTIYNVAAAIMRLVFAYVMTLIPKDWLFGYALGSCLISIFVNVLICCRACFVFSECRLLRSAFFDWTRIKGLARYAWWQVFGGVGYLSQHQCQAVVVNKFFGPIGNAVYSVSMTFGAEAASLTGALQGAFAPAICAAYGAKDMEFFRKMIIRACKFGTLLTTMFAVPMFLEVDEVLLLWLKNPPIGASRLCMFILAVFCIEKLTIGTVLGVNATGRVSKFQFCHGCVCFLSLPMSIGLILCCRSINMVGIALVVISAIDAAVNMFVSRALTGFGCLSWLKGVVMPVVTVVLISGMVACVFRMTMDQSFIRLCLTTFSSLVSMGIVSWTVLFDVKERAYVKSVIQSRLGNLM